MQGLILDFIFFSSALSSSPGQAISETLSAVFLGYVSNLSPPQKNPASTTTLTLFKSPSLLLGTWNCFLIELLISCPSVIYSPHSNQSNFLQATYINTITHCLNSPESSHSLPLEKTPVLVQGSEVSPTPISAITASLSRWTHASVHRDLLLPGPVRLTLAQGLFIGGSSAC